MEYVSIPWQNHRGKDSGESRLTVNLGLFVIHVLAGNSHCLGWTYPELAKETLTLLPCLHDMADKVAKTTNHRTTSKRSTRSFPSTSEDAEMVPIKKRKRAEEPDDEIAFSVAASFQFPSQVRILSDQVHCVRSH